MGFWTSYVGRRVRRRPAAVPDPRRRDAVPRAGRAGGAARPRARARVVRVDAALALRAVLPPADARRPRRHGRRLPRRHAAAPRRDRSPTTTSTSIQFLRTTYKAGALPALGIACLGGAALGRCGAGRAGVRAARRAWRAAAVAGAAGLAGARGVAAGERPRAGAPARLLRVPPAWRAVARDLDRRGDDTRAMVVPGPAVRLLPLGRDGRPDPARADEAPGRDPLDRAVRRPALGRPAVDGRRPHRPGAPAARPARAAARPHGRRRPRRRRRRRPLALSGEAPAGRRGRACSASGPARRGLRPDRARGAPTPATCAGAAGPRSCAGSAADRRARARAAALAADRRRRRRGRARRAGGLRRARPATGRCLRARSRPGHALRAAARDGGAFVIADTNRRRAFVASRLARRPRPDAHRRREPVVDGTLLDPFGGEPRRPQTVALVQRRAVGDGRRLAADHAVPRAPARTRRSTATPRPRGSPTARSSRRATPLTVAFTAPPRRRRRRPLPYSRQPRRRARGRDRRPPVRRPPRLEPPARSACATSTSLTVRLADVTRPAARVRGRRRHPRAAHPRRARHARRCARRR